MLVQKVAQFPETQEEMEVIMVEAMVVMDSQIIANLILVSEEVVEQPT